MTTWAEAADQMIALVGKLAALQGELADWSAGSADGGPDGDGRYPFTQPDGSTVLIPCPARLATGASFNVEGINALPEADSGDIGSSPLLVGSTEDGSEAKRWPIHLFASRKTSDRDVLSGGEYAEWIDCLSSTGMERKIAYSALLRAFGDVIDPTHPPYNVVYDYKKAKPVSCTSGSNRITASEAVFSSADIGKLASVSNGSSSVGALVGYIGIVEDSRNVRLFTTSAFATPLNATSTRGSTEIIWGTDNTAGLQAAFDAAEPKGRYDPGRVVAIGGIACATLLRFGSIAIVGLAETGCGFAALPVAGSQAPFFADKNSGTYATYRPHLYTIKNISIFGNKYCQYWSSFRRNFDIRGGGFGNFTLGAPYSRIDNIDLWEAQWDGFAGNGAFAGQLNNIRSYRNAVCGMRVALWDLNGQNWHVEANDGAGVHSLMAGGNVSTVRASYNGANAGGLYLSGGYWPDELGANWTEGGYGNTITNLRMQESWGHSLCISNLDPFYAATNGSKNAFFLGTFDDTGNIVPGHGGSSTRLPTVRAMVRIKGNTSINNTVDLVTGAGQVQTTNYATHGYYDSGDPSGNQVTLRTPGITNDSSSWYSGYSAASPGPWGTSSSSSIATRGNSVKINGATAP